MEVIYPNTNELIPQEIFQSMKSDFYKIPTSQITLISKEYIKNRKNLINLNHKLTKKMGFKSQTFFLSIYYLDIIFLQNKNIYIQNYNLLSLSCFIIAAKYCENDPNVPPLQSFIDLYNKFNMHQIGMKELLKMEVKILKYLNYDIHYVTSYDFNLFFFNHGIIKKQQIKDIINNNTNNFDNCNSYRKTYNMPNKNDLSTNEELGFVFDDSFYIKKILEKIYKKSRYYLDLIISHENICFKYDALLISVCIMKKSVEEVMLKEYKMKYKDLFMNKKQIIKKNYEYFKEIMTNFYNIDLDSDNEYNRIFNDIEIINLFQRQEKEKQKYEIKIKNNKIKENIFYNFTKIPSNYNTINIPNNTMNNNEAQIGSLVNLNNSMEKNKEKSGIKYNLTLIKNNNNNKQRNNIKIETENNIINSNSYIENVKKRYTFFQLKDNLKKDLSLRKKRCNDKFFHINNLKLLTSYANTIQNIKEGSLSKGENKNEINPENISKNLINIENNSTINTNRISTNTENISHNIYYIKNNSQEKNYKNYSKEKTISQINTNNKIRNAFQNKNKSLYGSLETKKDLKLNLNLENFDSNKMRYNKVIITDHFHSREKYNPKYLKNKTEMSNLETNRQPYYKKVVQNYEPMNKKIINKNNIKINIFNILNTSNNMNEISELEKKRNFISLADDMNYSQNKKNKIYLLKKRMNEINKMNKLKNLYNFKKLDFNLKNNLNLTSKEKRINVSPNSKSKEINYINIINEANCNSINCLHNNASTLENQSSYFKKKIFKSSNKNKKIIRNNNYVIREENIQSERDSEKLNINNKKLLTSIKVKDNDNISNNNINSHDININDIFKQKYNFQFRSKLFSTLNNK